MFMAALFLLLLIVLVFSNNDIILSDTFGGNGGNAFSFADKVGGKYPESITFTYESRIYKIYYEYGSIIAGGSDGTQKKYIFKENEFINLIKVCKIIVSAYNNDYIISYIYLKTNLNTELSGGVSNSNCKTYQPSKGYAIPGFYGRAYGEIDQIGCIYQKFYYNCQKLDDGQFCNYDRTEVLTETPDGYFLNDTNEKTIDRCYSVCKKCINYGNNIIHNCSECISNYYPKIDNINNCYKELEGYFYIITFITLVIQHVKNVMVLVMNIIIIVLNVFQIMFS